jgi:hypothetical protein
MICWRQIAMDERFGMIVFSHDGPDTTLTRAPFNIATDDMFGAS